MILSIPLTHRALLFLSGRPTAGTCQGVLAELGGSWLYRGPVLGLGRVRHYGCLACDRLLDHAELTEGPELSVYRMDRATYLKRRRRPR